MKGDIVSHSNHAIKNKQQGHPKVYFEQYLYNAGEPKDDISQDTPALLEAELLEDSYFLRRQLRRTARKLRNKYS